MTVKVIKPGLLTTVQDLGRTGAMRFGFARSGAMDPLAAAAANALLGQDIDSPLLECTLIGPVLEFDCDSIIAISGAQTHATLDGAPIALGAPVSVAAGQRLDLGRTHIGARSYLAFKGGLQLSPLLGSCATQLNVGLGGHQGRALRKEDSLSIRPCRLAEEFRQSSWLGLASPGVNTIAVFAGPVSAGFNGEAMEALLAQPWRVSSASDRMGYRLQGAKVPSPSGKRLGLTEPVIPGTIQLPGNGEPIVLMSDSQPTGGYPKLAQVAAVDLPLLAQLAPGDYCQFITCTLEQANHMRWQQQRQLNRMRAAAQRRWQEISWSYST
ncbi:5-oxoprolinase subunit C family protein [Ferrimonas marina]|uniref:Antagonist of KipI n=1 Tax=Ferrimonas marina TaxID=299255 RepID=A0A1M5RLK4_9GAMM|nr:biotin-dependent carboxyltransferase family protein [Ferrimonas marina]SHH26713.1 antagonist of KipI [Ferrimonas marina]